MKNEFKVGQLLFHVHCCNDLGSRYQHLTGYIDAGYLDADGCVRAINGTIVDGVEDVVWFLSKDEAIEELIRLLREMKTEA